MNINNNLSLLSILTIGLLLIGCTSERSKKVPTDLKDIDNLSVFTDINPSYKIALKPDITYSDTSKLLMGPIIKDLAVTSKGFVCILDFAQKKVHIFNSSGKYIESIGQEGRGPGEFLYITSVEVRNNEIHVLDLLQSKISIFSLKKFKHERDINISIKDSKPDWLLRAQRNGLNYRPNNFFILTNGYYLIVFSDTGVANSSNLFQRTYEFSLFNTEKNKYIHHNVLSAKWTGQVLINEVENSVWFNVPYKRSTQYDYANGLIVSNWTENYSFKFYDKEGKYKRAYYYPSKPIELKEEDVVSYYKNASDETIDAIRNDTLPDNWPAVRSVVLDNKHRLWVSTFTNNIKQCEWSVFAKSGKLLAKFHWPIHMKLFKVKNNYAYALKRLNNGLPRVMRYKVVLTKLK